MTSAQENLKSFVKSQYLITKYVVEGFMQV